MNLFKIKKYIKRQSLSHPKAKLLAFGGLLFALGLVVSVASTYAWYTISIMTNIDSLNIRVGVREDYYLKLYLDPYNTGDESTFKYSSDGYTLDEMGYDRATGLRDVSGMFESDWNNDSANDAHALPKFKKSYGSAPTSPQRSTEATEGFLQTVYYLESNKNCEVYLSPDSKVTANAEKNAETATKKGKSYDKLMQVTNAVRLSFFSFDEYDIDDYTTDGRRYVVANPGISEDTYFGGVLDMNGDGYYDYVDGSEILYGEYNTEAVTYNDKNGDSSPLEEAYRDTFNANHQAGVRQVNVEYTNETLAIKKENSVKIDALRYDEDSFKEVTPICRLKAGEKKRLVLSVYVEGWDRYMTDAIESAAFNIDIGFLALIKPHF